MAFLPLIITNCVVKYWNCSFSSFMALPSIWAKDNTDHCESCKGIHENKGDHGSKTASSNFGTANALPIYHPMKLEPNRSLIVSVPISHGLVSVLELVVQIHRPLELEPEPEPNRLPMVSVPYNSVPV